jgi:lysozyme
MSDVRFLPAVLALLAACGDPRHEPTLSTDVEALCPAGAVVQGVDVSMYQGTIEWPTVADAGIVFAIARLGDGMLVDSQFQTNWAGIADAGMVRGAYQFFEPGLDPNEQADAAVQAVGGTLGPGDLPIVADLEVTGGQSPATIVANLTTWATAVQAGTGRAPMIFASPSFWNANVASTAFGSLPLWTVQWGVMCPPLSQGWSNWEVWQYANNGMVAGIPGAVDLDEFNGDLAALRQFAAPTPDAGPSVDAGSAPDAGAEPDAGVDAGATPDAGSAHDAGTTRDAGSPSADAGTGTGSGTGCGCGAADQVPFALLTLLLFALRRRRS